MEDMINDLYNMAMDERTDRQYNIAKVNSTRDELEQACENFKVILSKPQLEEFEKICEVYEDNCEEYSKTSFAQGMKTAMKIMTLLI